MQATATKSGAAVTEALGKQLANWSVLYVKLHHCHWYVTGPRFFELHVKFEEYYNQAAAYVDEIAERMLAIGGKPASTMSDFLRLASIKEAAGNESAEQMAQAIAADFAALAKELGPAIEAAEQAGDASSADLLTGICTWLEKQLWMLHASGGSK